ncbi:D-alanyl-D-alanine carboxypeptidase family protein [Alteromonas sediminis]|uniref:D-alanyl-D-alanine carboxypeptidase family protein n=1 Tax=Alteromonas sediminis TaxID=2259342 RepID=A0A3N5Y2H3_9ALTE|nr:M15 family metallopeptidase [Alteromonas sediminis]RPJ67203.1 D-alanyl-D-alanine carboxypeptidase family protein [Alteromonas sediminis]
MINASSLFGLNDKHVTEVDEGISLHPDAATAFRAMQYTAHTLGIDCQIVSAFRPFTRQLAIWERKWRGEAPLYSAQGALLDPESLSEWEKIQAILTWSALPGASRHHWGTDLDVYDKENVRQCDQPFQLIESEYSGAGPCAQLADFIQREAHKFGFTLPYENYKGGVAKEPWHISYAAIAEDYMLQLTQDTLYQFIDTTSLSGKDCILKHFDEVYHRFVMNRGTQ